MAYLCPAVTPSTNPETDDGDLDPKDFDVPDLMDPANIVPFSEAWWDTQYKSKVAQAQQCAEPAYNTAGQLVGSAFVARDINAMAEALGQDGYIRYMGACSHYCATGRRRLLMRCYRLLIRHFVGCHPCRHVPRKSGPCRARR